MIKFQQSQALTSHFEIFWSIVVWIFQKFTLTPLFFTKITFYFLDCQRHLFSSSELLRKSVSNC